MSTYEGLTIKASTVIGGAFAVLVLVGGWFVSGQDDSIKENAKSISTLQTASTQTDERRKALDAKLERSIEQQTKILDQLTEQRERLIRIEAQRDGQ